MQENLLGLQNLNFEERVLNFRACFSKNSKGRAHVEKSSDFRTNFQKDRDRILYSKAFNRLRKKTQMLSCYQGDHHRTRLLHSLEVSQLARTAARLIGLNEDLVEAIALGHDVGHAPFGHAGEEVLNDICSFGFSHDKNGVRVVKFLEGGGKGLNLTYEVINGIEFHSFGDEKAETLEGRLVEFCDKIAYINHDIEDAKMAKILHEEDLPKDCLEILGSKRGLNIAVLIDSIVKNSVEDIAMDSVIFDAFIKLRAFMFDNVYHCKKMLEDSKRCKTIVEAIYYFYRKNYFKMPDFYINIAKKESLDRAVCDYVSGMSDEFIIDRYSEFFEAIK